MRFDRITLHNVGPFRDATLDLAAVPGRLVAVTGANGAGKSTCLELLAAAMYRECPTRGPLVGLATARDSSVEVHATNGKAWVLRHSLDAVSGKSSAVVLGPDGPAYDTDKVRAFDAWAASHLPPPEVLYASTFSPQGSGGFLELKPGDRKAVLLRVLGIERLETLAERARERARDARARHQVAAAREADERARGLSVAAAEQELAAARERADDAALEVSVRRHYLERAQDALADARTVWAASQRAQDERAVLVERETTLRRQVEDLDARTANNRRIPEDAADIRAAVERARALDAELPHLAEALSAARAAEAAAIAARDAAAALVARHEDGVRHAAQRETAATTRLAGAADVEAAVAELPAARAAADSRRAHVEELEGTLRALRDGLQHGSEARIGSLRGALESIKAPGAIEPGWLAAEALADDNVAAERIAAAPERIRLAEADVSRARLAALEAQRAVASVERLAARAEDVRAARAELAAALAERSEVRALMDAARSEAAAAEGAAREASAVASGAATAHAAARSERAELEPRLRLADKLAAAEARLAELEPQRQAAARELADVQQTLVCLPTVVGAAPTDERVRAARAAVEAASKEAASAAAAVAVREAALSDARASAARLADLAAAALAVADEVADWERLSQDLGRDGLQALEIDAAGPELTTLVNDLLHTCVGPRWTVSIEASRTSADGKKTLEGCEVRVLDTERGRDAAAESLSGGEKVIVSEAVSLALAMLACRRSGVRGATLVRDESGAALDASNARAYVAMLRRAADIVGASQVLLVSHAVEVQELCDARVVVADGGIEVRP